MTVNKNVPWLVTGFLTLLLWLQTCRLNNKIEEKDKQITQTELEKQELHTTINRKDKTIQLQNAIIVDNTQALDNLTDTIFDLKKKDAKNRETIAYYKGVTNTELKKVLIPYLDTLAMKKFSDSLLALVPPDISAYIRDSMITVPASSRLKTPHFDIAATAKKEGIVIDSLSIPDTLQLRFVQHKRGWFRSDQIEVQYFHSNPYVQSLSANSAFYKPKKKSFFQRVILPVAVGVGAGILISK